MWIYDFNGKCDFKQFPDLQKKNFSLPTIIYNKNFNQHLAPAH